MIDDDPIENIEVLKSPLNLVYKIEYYYDSITIIYFVDLIDTCTTPFRND